MAVCRVWEIFIDREHLSGCKAPLNIIHSQVLLASKLLLTFSFLIVVVVNIFIYIYRTVVFKTRRGKQSMCILSVQIHDGTSQSNSHRDAQSTLHVSFYYLLNYIE